MVQLESLHLDCLSTSHLQEQQLTAVFNYLQDAGQMSLQNVTFLTIIDKVSLVIQTFCRPLFITIFETVWLPS